MPHPPGIMGLPNSLVLLLHLHIMAYPHCNSPEYTPDLFAPRRPLRARTGTMEDIVAFLVEKIEGKEKFKFILGGVYPCLQPSDSVSFRTAAAKYMEALRASVIRPVSSTVTSNGRAPSVSTSLKNTNSHSTRSKLDASSENNPHPAAWWWSSIVVRKSLLEECAGERFEKMLLAISTHALSIQIPRSSSLHPKNSNISSDELQDQAREYANLLSHAFDLHAQRLQVVVRLNVRTQVLLALRARLLLAPTGDTNRPDTKRIVAVRDSKWHDLVDAWNTTLIDDQSLADVNASVNAENALKWLIAMSSVSSTTETLPPSNSSQPEIETNPQLSLTPIQPLPIASAHHPANVHKLTSLPAFKPILEEFSMEGDSHPSTSAALEMLLGESTSQRVQLKAALNAATTEGEGLKIKLNVALKKAREVQTLDTRAQEGSVNLWDLGDRIRLDFEAPSTLPLDFNDFFKDLNIAPSHTDISEAERQHILEDRVLALRNSLKPQFPSLTERSIDHPQPENPSIQLTQQRQVSKHPMAKQAHALAASSSKFKLSFPQRQSRTSRTPRPYQTSTPPTKSRPQSVRKTKDLQRPQLGINETPFATRETGGLKWDDEQQAEEISSDDYDGLRTPTGPRRFVPLAPIKTVSRQEEMITNMSLPDFSDGNLTSNGIIMSDENETEEDQLHDEQSIEDGDDEVPYEGHSVTLRDMLIKAGNGEDISHIIDADLGEGIGDETMGWG